MKITRDKMFFSKDLIHTMAYVGMFVAAIISVGACKSGIWVAAILAWIVAGIEQESRRELYDGLKRLTQREQTYLLYRYGFTDGEEHPLIGTAIYFHLTKGRAKKTEEQAMDNLWLELPWWFI